MNLPRFRYQVSLDETNVSDWVFFSGRDATPEEIATHLDAEADFEFDRQGVLKWLAGLTPAKGAGVRASISLATDRQLEVAIESPE